MLKSLLRGASALVIAAAAHGAARARSAPPWLSAWTAAPAGTTGIVLPGTQTIRDIISPRRLGDTIRLHLTNRQGTLPVTFSQVFVGLQDSGAQLVTGSSKPFTFGGKPSVTLLPGQDIISDPLSYPVKSYQKLAISMQNGDPVAGIPVASSTHSVSRELNYYFLGAPAGGLVSGAGAAGSDSGDGYLPFVLTQGVTFEASWEYIEGLDVASTAATSGPRTVVAFGDSISDGLTVNPTTDNTFIENVSNLGAEQRFEDYLQLRFNAKSRYKAFTILNGAIAGNRLTQGPFAPFFGPKGLDRLAPDVLAVPGVTDVIIQLGINDIAFDIPAQTLGSHQVGTDLENAYVSVINTLHAHGIRAILSTITPGMGAGVGMFSPAVNSLPGGLLPTPVSGGALHGTAITDSIRREVNAWIMSTGAQIADAVVDSASCVADPNNTSYLNPAYNSGDNLHPNAAGYQAIANCVNLPAVFP